MCRGCVEDGSISERVYLLIELFNKHREDAQLTNAHIVLADCNIEDSHIDWCLAKSLDDEVRGFLELLRALPEKMRLGVRKEEDDAAREGQKS